MLNDELNHSEVSDDRDTPVTEPYHDYGRSTHTLKRNADAAVQYDESEGVSDTSFASESCNSVHSRRMRGLPQRRATHIKVCDGSISYLFTYPGACCKGSRPAS